MPEVAAFYCLHNLWKLSEITVLQAQPLQPAARRCKNIALIVMRSEHDDFCRRLFLAHHLDKLPMPSMTGKTNVKKHDIRLQSSRTFRRLRVRLKLLRLSLDCTVALQQTPQGFAHVRMIFDQQDSDFSVHETRTQKLRFTLRDTLAY